MNPLSTGAVVIVMAVFFLFSGMPIAFALGVTSLAAMLLFMDSYQVAVMAETIFEGVNDFGMLSIPLFIFMGMIAALTRAGADLYECFHRWLVKVPGGLGIGNIGACSLFAALTGSSPACAAAIGTMGIPEMRKRGYPAGLAAGIIPGLMMTALFSAYVPFAFRRHTRRAVAAGMAPAEQRAYSFSDKLSITAKILPLIVVVALVLSSLYTGWATPSEAAGVGAFLVLLVAMALYRMYRPRDLKTIMMRTCKESTMIMMIIATSFLFGSILTHLYIAQTLAAQIVSLEVNRWVIMALINVLLLVAGCFLPPVAIILIICPILHPIITGLGFDPIWFGVVITLNLEAGLITPPVGLNLYIVHGIAPDIPLQRVLQGSIPFVLLLLFGIVILSIFPQLATWLPHRMIG